VVDVDDFFALISVGHRDRPVRPDCFVKVDRAFVMAVMQPSWPDERIKATLIDSVNDRFNHDPDVVHVRFCNEGKSARSANTRWQSSNNFVRSRWVQAEQRSVVAFDLVQNRHFAVSFFFVVGVFDQLAVVRADRNQRPVISQPVDVKATMHKAA